jgi:hypothetical protein
MSRTLERVLAALTVMAIPAVASASGPSNARITVKPRTGSVKTRFVVSFRAPQRSGRLGSFQRHYVLDAAGPAGADHCVSRISVNAPDSAANVRVRVTLNPTRVGGRWCVGRFHGKVEEFQTPVCPKGELCPAYVALLKTVGTFSFSVKSASGDSKPPRFDGLEHASTCFRGPGLPGVRTRYTLSWKAASDNLTRRERIVYDVYESTTPRGEQFSKPTWVSAPGATTFTTPGLIPHRSFYFVVRARDQAGNEDHNRVERRGLDPCI